MRLPCLEAPIKPCQAFKSDARPNFFSSQHILCLAGRPRPQANRTETNYLLGALTHPHCFYCTGMWRERSPPECSVHASGEQRWLSLSELLWRLIVAIFCYVWGLWGEVEGNLEGGIGCEGLEIIKAELKVFNCRRQSIIQLQKH